MIPRTKLLPPRVDDHVVLDPGLLEAVRAATRLSSLTVIRAQGGSGKTTLAAAVVAAETERPVAWIGLDETDDASALMHLLAHGVGPAIPGGCPVFSALLRADLPAAHDPRRLIGALVNDILTAGAPPLLLVLDDLHVVTDPVAVEVVQYLVARAPDELRVLVTTRTPPPGLSRLGAQRRITEFTGEDLRLTQTQADAVLNDRLGLGMTAAQIEAVVDAADGWVTGVRLLAGRGASADAPTPDVAPQQLYDYLVEEILDREPVEARDVLLATCVLDEVTPAAAQELTSLGNAGEILAATQSRNHLLVHLAGPDVYRYHGLFGEFLRSHVERRAVGGVAALHARAAVALAGTPAAVEHLIAAGDDDGAAAAIEQRVRGDIPTGLSLVHAANQIEQLTSAAWSSRPWLTLVVGVGALQRGDRQLAVPLIEGAFQAMEAAGDQLGRWMCARHLHHATYDNERFVPIFLEIEASPDFEELPAAARVEHFMSSVYGVMAAGQWEEVDRRVGLAIDLAQTCRLQEASEVLALHLSPLLAVAPGTSDRIARHAGWSARTFGDNPLVRLGAGSQHAFTAVLQGDLETAHEHAAAVVELPDLLGGLPYQSLSLDWTLAVVALARGDLAAAQSRVKAPRMEAGELDDPVQWARLAFAARVHRLLGSSTEESLRGFELRNRQAQFQAGLTPLVERSLEGQVAWARGDLAAAEQVLRAGLDLQEESRLLPFVNDLRLDLALVLHAAGRVDEACSALDGFLTAIDGFGAPGMGLFAGPEAIPLLRAAGTRSTHRDLIGRLLATLDADHRPDAVPVAATQETLTSREVEVLRLIAAGATNADIAARLFISDNTVKTHVRRVLAKVGADTRAQAVIEARRLGVG